MTATTQEQTAADFLGFFKNFQDTFGIKNYKIYVTGESYAGRYVPYVSAAMLDKDDKQYYNLSGAILYDPVIGNGWVQSEIIAYPYVQQYSQFFNLNSTFMSQMETAHEKCGFKQYLDEYMTFPASKVQPTLGQDFGNAPGVNCDVWGSVSEVSAIGFYTYAF